MKPTKADIKREDEQPAPTKRQPVEYPTHKVKIRAGFTIDAPVCLSKLAVHQYVQAKLHDELKASYVSISIHNNETGEAS